MFKNILSKIAWIVTLMFGCMYIFSSMGNIITNLMENSTIAYVIICVIFAGSVAGVFMDIMAKFEELPKKRKEIEDR